VKIKISLGLKCTQYKIFNGIISRECYVDMLLRCPEKDKEKNVWNDFHDSPTSYHFSIDTIAHKFLMVGHYCPTFFKHGHEQISTNRYGNMHR